MTMTAAGDAGDNALLRPAPFLASVTQIEPQWIDYNGHLNMAYYNVMFDRAVDQLWLALGIGPGYREQRRIDLHRRMPCALLARNPSRRSRAGVGAAGRRGRKAAAYLSGAASCHRGWLSATSENMSMHIDMAARKTAPFPPDIRARIETLANAHKALPRPEGIGRSVAMPSKR
jgi:acyl-CoA thioester hydrolase